MFDQKQREIFAFEYEGKKRFADPQRIWRLWFKALKGRDITSLFAQINAENPANDQFIDDAAEAASEVLLEAILKAFELKPLQPDGTGATEGELLAIFNQWSEYIEEKKTQGENSQTCSPPTGPESPPSSPTTTGSPSG